MQLKCNFEVMEFDSQKIAVPVGENANEFHGVIKLNETAAFILEQLKEEASVEAIVEALKAEYDAPQELLEADVRKCIEEFTNKGLLSL